MRFKNTSGAVVADMDRHSISVKLGRLDVELGGMAWKFGPLWIWDGLSVWWGDRGVHLFWRKSRHDSRRVVWERRRDEPTIPETNA